MTGLTVERCTPPVGRREEEPRRVPHAKLRRDDVVKVPAEEGEDDRVEHHHPQHGQQGDVLDLDGEVGPGGAHGRGLELCKELDADAECAVGEVAGKTEVLQIVLRRSEIPWQECRLGTAIPAHFKISKENVHGSKDR